MSCCRFATAPSAAALSRTAVGPSSRSWRAHSPLLRVANSAVTTHAANPRVAEVSRETKETSVSVRLGLDGTGVADVDTGIPFLDHMLDQIASHGLIDVTAKAKGDTWIDDHHTNEDLGLAFGTCLSDALGDRAGIVRFGQFSAPLDEALVRVVLDLSGRPHLTFRVPMPTERVGSYDTQLVEHFFQSMVNTSGMTLHIHLLEAREGGRVGRARPSDAPLGAPPDGSPPPAPPPRPPPARPPPPPRAKTRTTSSRRPSRRSPGRCGARWRRTLGGEGRSRAARGS